MIITNKINVYLHRNGEYHMDAVQGDTARILELALYAGASEWNLPEGTRVQLRFRKPDGTGGVYDTLPDGSCAYEISGNKVTLALAPQVLTVPGEVEFQAVLLWGAGELATFTIRIHVQKDPSLGVLESADFVNLSDWVSAQVREYLKSAQDELRELFATPGALFVNVAYSEDSETGYVSDKTYGEIAKAAPGIESWPDGERPVYCVLWSAPTFSTRDYVILPLSSCNPSLNQYIFTRVDNGVELSVHISETAVWVNWQALAHKEDIPKAALFVNVAYSEDSETGYVADKTYEELYEAAPGIGSAPDGERAVYCVLWSAPTFSTRDYVILPLSGYDPGLKQYIFTRMDNGIELSVHISETAAWVKWWSVARKSDIPTVTDGETPHIGDNGNWWIGEEDTGVKAAGEDGRSVWSVELDTSQSDESKSVYSMTDDGDRTIGSFAVYHGKDGEDYVLTDDDKDEIAEAVKTEVPLIKSAEEPTIVGSVDEMSDTSKHYVLSSDGYFYAYAEIANHNLFKVSEVEFSSRLQNDVEGTVSSTASNAVTGWIPVEYGKYYCMSVLHDGVRTVQPSGSGTMHKRMNAQKLDGTILVYNSGSVPFAPDVEYSKQVIHIEQKDIVAIRLHFCLNPSTNPDISTAELLKVYAPMIVEGATPEEAYQNAMNLEYINGDEETVAKWVSTGLAYNQPADYEGRIIGLESEVSELQADVTKLKVSGKDPASASPYYRDVNFGMVPASYYQGVGTDYESEGFGKDTQYADFVAAWKALIADHSSYVTERELGAASDGQMLYLYDFKPARIGNQNKPIPKIIIVAGQHGTEKANVFGWYYFVRDLLNGWNQHPALDYLRNHVELMIVPVVNTYGFDHFTYKNGNGVNINRNYDSNWVLHSDPASDQYGGAEPFDQPESQIVRDLILGNGDALLVIDSHVCDGNEADSYEAMTYYGVCASSDEYYKRMLDVVAHQLTAISAHFDLDYALNQPNTIMGYLNTNTGNGILRSWVTDNSVIGVLVEGFTGFPGDTAFSGRAYKGNEEIVTNYLVTALHYLGK